MSLRRADEAVTPIIGTVFILGITVAGMAVILLLGAPVLQRLQDEGALRSMAGQLETVRSEVSSLSIPQTAKAPAIAGSGGSISLESGDHIMVTVDMDTNALYRSCDFHVSGWSDFTAVGTSKTEAVTTSGCRTPTVSCTAAAICIRVGYVDTTSGGVVDTPVTFSAGSIVFVSATQTVTADQIWRFRLVTAGVTPVTDTVYAESWLLPTDRLHWFRGSGAGGAEASFEAGAIFLASGGQQYLEADPFIVEKSTMGASPPYLLRVPTLTASPSASISGSSNHDVLLSLLGSDVRVQSETATRIRFDINGPLARPWCDALVLRSSLAALPTGFTYTADGAFPCNSGSSDGTRSVIYVGAASSSATTSCSSTPSTYQCFPFQFSHARITATLQL